MDLLFNYDLLGYGMMALSTFFIGLFISCFIMPMTGVFTNMATGETGNGGTIALLIWCAYFFPIGVSLHFA